MAAFVEECQEGFAQVVAGHGLHMGGIARWAGSYSLLFCRGEFLKGASL